MRVLRVSYRIPPERGGKERHVDCLTRAQLREGHEVAVAFRHGSVLPEGAEAVRLRPTGLSLAVARRSDVAAFAAEVAHTLRRGTDIDLVHLHGDHVESAILGPACRRRGIPLVLTVHGALAQRNRWLARWALRHVGAFIALGSRPTQDLLALGADPRRILTASSGLDLAAISRSRSAVTEPGLVVSVGSLDPVKDHALVIEAVRRMRPHRPWLRLVIVGDGPERSRLARLTVGDLGIELAGPLPRDEVYHLVARAQVFVLASRRLSGKGEGIPTAALEALGLGTPVLLSTEASLDPVVEPDAYRTFTAGSVDALMAHLHAMLSDDELRRRLSECGIQAAAALDWSVVARRFGHWYGTCLPGEPAAREVIGDQPPTRV